MARKNRNRYGSFNQSRENGWGIGLYRHPTDSWLGGVCAGLAEYWDVPTWVTRLSVFALFLMFSHIAVADTVKFAVTDVEGLEKLQVEWGPFKEALEK